jgi:Protein of unknown function (DUF3300)
MKKRLSLFSGLLLLSSCLATASAQSITPGTEIRVQLLSPLDTGKTQAGEEFSATLADPIEMDNGAVWPKGTEVEGKVVDVVSSGRLSRPASITLQLTQIGKSPLQTETARIDGQSHAGRNTALIGGVAAVGAILGGIAGGGKGALIGTAAGATAGVATAAATGKQEIVLPAETLLTFAMPGAAATDADPPGPAPESSEAAPPQDPPQDAGSYEAYSAEQLDNLLAPVALYPDPLLAQVLVAATFPDQVEDAAPWVRGHNPSDIDYQPWDVSIKAVAHYPTVLDMLDQRLDWTTALGQAYAYQSTDVMLAVQRLRNLAYSQGNLVTTPEQQVVVARGAIQIVPAQPRVIFVPAYDPGVIYARRVYRPGFGFGSYYTFGRGLVIGAWLNYDLDWGSRRVVYEGWEGHRDPWRERSRPYVRVTNVYVSNRYETVHVNRTVVNRHVDYHNVDRYNAVHHEVTYENHARFEAKRTRNESVRPGERPGQPAWQRPPEARRDERDIHVQQRPVEDRSRPQTERPDDASFRRANPEPPRAEPLRPQPPNTNRNDHDFRNQQGPFREEARQPQRAGGNAPGRANQAAPPVERVRSQAPIEKVNDQANVPGTRSQLERPAMPARVVSPATPPAGQPAAQPARRSDASEPKPQQSQRVQRQSVKGDKSDKSDSHNKAHDNRRDKE